MTEEEEEIGENVPSSKTSFLYGVYGLMLKNQPDKVVASKV